MGDFLTEENILSQDKEVVEKSAGEKIQYGVNYAKDTIGDAAAGIVSYYDAFKDTLSGAAGMDE